MQKKYATKFEIPDDDDFAEVKNNLEAAKRSEWFKAERDELTQKVREFDQRYPALAKQYKSGGGWDFRNLNGRFYQEYSKIIDERFTKPITIVCRNPEGHEWAHAEDMTCPWLRSTLTFGPALASR